MANLTLAQYQEAERVATAEASRRGLMVHSVITVAVCALLVILNVTVASEFPWSVFPVIGMTIGVAAHWYFGVHRGEASVRQHQHDVERRAAA